MMFFNPVHNQKPSQAETAVTHVSQSQIDEENPARNNPGSENKILEIMDFFILFLNLFLKKLVVVANLKQKIISDNLPTEFSSEELLVVRQTSVTLAGGTRRGKKQRTERPARRHIWNIRRHFLLFLFFPKSSLFIYGAHFKTTNDVHPSINKSMRISNFGYNYKNTIVTQNNKYNKTLFVQHFS